MTAMTAGQAPGGQLLSCHEILRIAQQDAESAYRDLSGYRITLVLQPDGWHIDYDLTEPYMAGGGPHYIIDPTSGAILWKTYEQ
jgi:hypothetical protein